MILRRTLGLNANRAPGYFAISTMLSHFPIPRRGMHHRRLADRRCFDDSQGCFLWKLGFLDEAYFFHDEDADWGLAVSRSRWETWFVPEAVVTHFRGRLYQKVYFRRTGDCV